MVAASALSNHSSGCRKIAFQRTSAVRGDATSTERKRKTRRYITSDPQIHLRWPRCGELGAIGEGEETVANTGAPVTASTKREQIPLVSMEQRGKGVFVEC